MLRQFAVVIPATTSRPCVSLLPEAMKTFCRAATQPDHAQSKNRIAEQGTMRLLGMPIAA